MPVTTKDAGKTPAAKPQQSDPITIAHHVPSFIPAGTQAELDATGEAVNPFTGERLTGPVKRLQSVNTGGE